MKNLFLYAKHFAIEENAEYITMKHIIKAAEEMNLGGEKLEKDILEYISKYKDEDDYKLRIPF